MAASAEETVELLSQLAKRTGHHGEADRMARARHARVAKTRSADIIVSGLHQYLEAFIEETKRAVVKGEKKDVSSTAGMQHSVKTSPMMAARINEVVPARMAAVSRRCNRRHSCVRSAHSVLATWITYSRAALRT